MEVVLDVVDDVVDVDDVDDEVVEVDEVELDDVEVELVDDEVELVVVLDEVELEVVVKLKFVAFSIESENSAILCVFGYYNFHASSSRTCLRYKPSPQLYVIRERFLPYCVGGDNLR